MFINGTRIIWGLMVVAAWLLLGSNAFSQQVQFNYNGRVNAHGNSFNGEGQFKLALTNGDGTVTYWANDGVTLDGTEPTSAVTVTINDGFFSIDVGDTSLAGMAGLSASLFNSEGDVYLRTWFSDGNNGFERLLPDRKVVNPALLGLINFNEFNTIYVDPINGYDHRAGLTTETAKRTIQAAWDAVPHFVRRDITIQLLDGVYREFAALEGKNTTTKAEVTIRGNVETPESVLITGAEASNESVSVRESAFEIDAQKNLNFKGLSFAQHSVFSVFVRNGASVKVENCLFRNTRGGLYITNMAYAEVRLTELRNITFIPIYAQFNSLVMLTDSYVHHCTDAINIVNSSSITLTSNRFAFMNVAVAGAYNSLVSYNPNITPWNRFESCSTGTYGNLYCTYANTPTKVSVGPGGAYAEN
jgi:hypothetical protein